MTAVVFDQRVLAGGEGLAEGKRVLHDLQDEVHMLVGGVHEERRGTMSTVRNGGGRSGASMYPTKGWRTWRDGARTSIVESWGCYSGT
jgi:hypothetical protein